MILSSFSYKTNGWELTEMNAIQATNLLVGKNASGKTRTIRALQNVTNFLQMKPIVFEWGEFKTKLSFEDTQNPGWKMVYAFEIAQGKVVSEQLTVNGKSQIKRTAEKTMFMDEPINPPTEKLVVQVRRDRAAYPDVEELMKWAEGVISVSCSNINPFTMILTTATNIVNPLPFSTMVEALSKEGMKQGDRYLFHKIIDV